MVVIDAVLGKDHCFFLVGGQKHESVEEDHVFFAYLSNMNRALERETQGQGLTSVIIVSVVTVARLKYPPVVPSASFFNASVFWDIASLNTGHICMMILKINCSPGGHRRFWTSVTTSSDSLIIVNNGMIGGIGSNTERKNVYRALSMSH